MRLDCKETGMQMEKLKTFADTPVKSFEMEWMATTDIGSPPFPIHPAAEEIQEIPMRIRFR